MIHEFIEIVKEIGVATGVNVVMEKMKAKVGEHAAEEVKKKLTDEHRAELLAYLGELGAYNEVASKNLLRRQAERNAQVPRSYGGHEKYKPGDEDRYVTLLTKLYLALNDEHEKNARMETFGWLGEMSDEEFDAALELLNHDVILQYAQKGWWIIQLAWGKFYCADPDNLGVWQKRYIIQENFRKADRKTAGILWKLDKWLDKKGVR